MPIMDFLPKRLPAVMRGPGLERRRLLVDGSACWASVSEAGEIASTMGGASTGRQSLLRVKGADGLLPLGPGLVSGINILEQPLRTYRNAQRVQEAHIEDEMIWGPHYMIADIVRHITLVPGDVILIGMPCHSRSLAVGDSIGAEVTGLGRLPRRVVAGPVHRASALGVGHALTDSAEVRRVALGNDERVPQRFRDGYQQAADKS